MAKATLSSCEYFYSACVRDLNANETGSSSQSTKRDKMPAIPIGLASQASCKGNDGS